MKYSSCTPAVRQILKNEVDFLYHVGLSEGMIVRYIVHQKQVPASVVAAALEVPLAELSELKKKTGRLCAERKERLRMLVGG